MSATRKDPFCLPRPVRLIGPSVAPDERTDLACVAQSAIIHVHVGIAEKRNPEPREHHIGRLCSAKLVRAPIVAKRWGQRRKPRRMTEEQRKWAEGGMHLEEVDAEPEAD